MKPFLQARRLLPLLPLAALGLLTPTASAGDPEHDWGVWVAFAGQGHLSPGDPDARWRAWLDLHARFLDDSDGFEQSIVRPGIGYDLDERSTVWLGYGWIRTDPASGKAFDEDRIWQQYTWGGPLGDYDFFWRSRLEQRWIEDGDDVGWRFRQFVRFTRPLEAGSRLGFRTWDEGFFDLNDTDWGADTGFAQNRLFLGLGWGLETSMPATLEFGYLNQFISRPSRSDAMNHILAVTWLQSW